MPEEMAEFAHLPSRLVQARQRRLLSQQKLAERAGLSVATVSRLERGHGTPHFSTILKLARALGVNERELVQ